MYSTVVVYLMQMERDTQLELALQAARSAGVSVGAIEQRIAADEARLHGAEREAYLKGLSAAFLSFTFEFGGHRRAAADHVPVPQTPEAFAAAPRHVSMERDTAATTAAAATATLLRVSAGDAARTLPALDPGGRTPQTSGTARDHARCGSTGGRRSTTSLPSRSEAFLDEEEDGTDASGRTGARASAPARHSPRLAPTPRNTRESLAEADDVLWDEMDLEVYEVEEGAEEEEEADDDDDEEEEEDNDEEFYAPSRIPSRLSSDALNSATQRNPSSSRCHRRQVPYTAAPSDYHYTRAAYTHVPKAAGWADPPPPPAQRTPREMARHARNLGELHAELSEPMARPPRLPPTSQQLALLAPNSEPLKREEWFEPSRWLLLAAYEACHGLGCALQTLEDRGFVPRRQERSKATVDLFWRLIGAHPKRARARLPAFQDGHLYGEAMLVHRRTRGAGVRFPSAKLRSWLLAVPDTLEALDPPSTWDSPPGSTRTTSRVSLVADAGLAGRGGEARLGSAIGSRHPAGRSVARGGARGGGYGRGVEELSSGGSAVGSRGQQYHEGLVDGATRRARRRTAAYPRRDQARDEAAGVRMAQTGDASDRLMNAGSRDASCRGRDGRLSPRLDGWSLD